MRALRKLLRNHLHFIVVVFVLLVVMTWPTIRYVFDTEVFWLPTKVFDVWTKFWNAWFGKLLLTGQAEYSYTDLMFYPNGVSLDFHNFAMPHMLLQNVFGAFLPDVECLQPCIFAYYLCRSDFRIRLPALPLPSPMDKPVRCNRLRL